jgi:hypothetical protein
MTDRERIALDEEAQSLPIHVRMCAFRHADVMDEIRETRADLDQRLAALEAAANKRLARIEKAAYAILGLIGTIGGATLTQLAPIMQALAGQ